MGFHYLLLNLYWSGLNDNSNPIGNPSQSDPIDFLLLLVF